MSVEVGRVTAIVDGDISALTSALSLAKTHTVDTVAGIEKGVKGQVGSGITGAVNWSTLGKQTATEYISGITAGFGPMGTALEGVATALGPTGLIATAAIAGSAVVIKAAWDASSAWEMGMSQISKTTGIGKGTTEFSQLNEDLKDLYSTMPTTATEIQNVAKAAGSLGIETDSIAGFTRVALEMGSAFDIPAEQAATSIGKVQSQLKSLPEGIEDSAEFARHLGSAVDFAGNSLNATEAEVLDFSTRAAGALSLLGGSAYELAGWGGVTASVFSSSQLAAGSFNAALTNLTGVTKGSLNAQSEAAGLLGVTTDEFARMMSTDPTDTILRIGSALEQLDPTAATKAASVIGGGYGDDFWKKLIGHTDEWRGSIEEVVAAGEKGESIGNSFQSGSDNAKSAIQELKNSLNTILIDTGGPLLEAVAPLLRGLAGGLNDIRTIGENLWGPLTTVLGPLTTSVGVIVSGAGTMAGLQLDGLVLASEALNKAWEIGGKYADAIKAEIIEIIENSSTFQTASGYVNDLRDAFQRLYDKVSEVYDKIITGLTDAIPTAIKGTADALGTLGEKAGLGGLTDTTGGIFDFFGDVNARVWGEDIGKETADGIKGSSLKNAPKDTIDAGKTDALAAASELGTQIGHAIGEKVEYTTSQSWNEGVTKNVKSKWEDTRGEVFGAVNVGGVSIAAVGNATKGSTDIVLTTEGGQEIDRRSIYTGEFAGDSMGAIYDMIKSNPEEFGNLTELESAEFAGDIATAETLKIKAAQVNVETTTEARLRELSSLDIETLKANIAEIETEIAGLSQDLQNVDKAFEEMSIEPVDMVIALQTSQAREDWNLLVNDIEGLTVRMPVELDVRVHADEIRAMIAEELRASVV
jgi:TP901 family phage tail tape measure protein